MITVTGFLYRPRPRARKMKREVNYIFSWIAATNKETTINDHEIEDEDEDEYEDEEE